MADNKNKLIELAKKIHVLYKDTFDTPNGKLVLEDLENKYYVNKSTSGKDEQIDMFLRGMREGERVVVLYIKNMLSDKQLKRLGVEENDN